MELHLSTWIKLQKSARFTLQILPIFRATIVGPHGEVQFNKYEKLQDAVLINMLMPDLYKY